METVDLSGIQSSLDNIYTMLIVIAICMCVLLVLYIIRGLLS